MNLTTSFYAHPSCVIDPGAHIGDGSKIWHFSHIFSGARIGAHCVFGQNCSVAAKVVVGDGCKIQNGVSLYDGVTLEDAVFCGPHMVFTNCPNPRAFINRREAFHPTLLKKGCSIGASAIIVCGTTLGEYAFVGAGAVVTKDVKPYALVYGNPARQHGWVGRSGNPLDFSEDTTCTDPEDGSTYHLKNNQVFHEDKLQ